MRATSMKWPSGKGSSFPKEKCSFPGSCHATPVVEHPELAAYRIQRFVQLVGAENVMAGADCGFGGRSHPQIGWAKLKVLVEGAALASRQKSAA
jgi:5-methyltetrahydropteroyltriglutamate--homocysteine methyltransferase